jgi:thermitase
VIRRGVVLAVLVSISVLGFGTLAHAATPRDAKSGSVQVADRDANTILVRFRDRARGQDDVNAEGDGIAGQSDTQVAVVKLKAGSDVDAKLAAYRAHGNVVFAEPNYLAHATLLAPNDPSYSQQWAYAKIQAVDGWGLYPGAYTTSGGAAIALVDTGVDSAHPDLAGRVNTAAGANCVNVSSTCTGDIALDDNGHGTHVAGIAGAATNNATGVAGTAFSSPLIPVKVLDSSGSGTYAAVANGILWGAQHGARVISLSLGGSGFSQTLCDAVTTAISTYGAMVVAAAGNSGTNAASYPAACPGTVGVAATDSSDGSPSWSNFGAPDVFVSAPGVNIYSTCAPSTSTCGSASYASLSGTSMATPFVSGLASLLFGQVPARSVGDVKNVLKTTSDHVGGVTYGSDPSGTCTNCWHDWYGYGRINLFRALSAAGTPPAPATLASVSLNPTAVTGGSPSVGTAALTAAAPAANATVTLTSDNASVVVPASVTIPAGQTSATFNVSTSTVATPTLANISGTYNATTQSATLTVNPAPADFSLSASPSSASVQRGQSRAYTITITWGSGTTGPVSLSVSGLPTRTSATFNPNPATASSTMTVNTNRKAPRETYTLTITGTRGGLTHTTTANLTLT